MLFKKKPNSTVYSHYEMVNGSKNPRFAVIDNKREGKNTRVFVAESHNMNIGSNSVNTPHYHIIKDAYTNEELDKMSKRLGHKNTGEFLKSKVLNGFAFLLTFICDMDIIKIYLYRGRK